MAEPKLSVLDYETKLAFRRRTKEGWVPGLPRRKHKSEYSDYGEDGETLSILLSGIDAIKEPFADRRATKHLLVLTSMPVRDEADALANRLGTALWPGREGRTPAFIDPTYELDFSIEEHRERIKGLFFRMVMVKAFRYIENQSRSADEATQQQPHSAEDESGGASEYNPTPREIIKVAKKRARTTVKTRGPYMTKRRREELRASQDPQGPAEIVHAEVEPSTSATVKRATPSVNDHASLNDQSCEVIDLEDERRETIDTSLDACEPLEPVMGRGGKRRAMATRCVPSKRPRRAIATKKSLPDHPSHSPGLEAQPAHSASAQSDHLPNPSPELESHVPSLTKQPSPSKVPFSVNNADDAFDELPTMPDVSQPKNSDQIDPLDTLSPSTGALQHSQSVFEDHACPDEQNFDQTNSRSTIEESSIDSYKLNESAPRTTAASLDLPTLSSHTTPLQDNSDRQFIREPSNITSTTVSLDRGSIADVNSKMFQNTVDKISSEPPLGSSTKVAFSHEIEHLKSDVTHLTKSSLDDLLSETDVRLCFGEIDHVIMYLEGCHTLVDLFASVRLYLEEEIGNEQISYIDVAQDCDQEFRVNNKTMKRLRLLPGPGRERTYDTFLCLLTNTPTQGDSHSFKMYVHVKGNRGV